MIYIKEKLEAVSFERNDIKYVFPSDMQVILKSAYNKRRDEVYIFVSNNCQRDSINIQKRFVMYRLDNILKALNDFRSLKKSANDTYKLINK